MCDLLLLLVCVFVHSRLWIYGVVSLCQFISACLCLMLIVHCVWVIVFVPVYPRLVFPDLVLSWPSSLSPVSFTAGFAVVRLIGFVY